MVGVKRDVQDVGADIETADLDVVSGTEFAGIQPSRILSRFDIIHREQRRGILAVRGDIIFDYRCQHILRVGIAVALLDIVLDNRLQPFHRVAGRYGKSSSIAGSSAATSCGI